MTAHQTLSHEALTAWAELVYADRRGWKICEFRESDRARAFRELVRAELGSEEDVRADGYDGPAQVFFRLTDHGRRLWDAER